MSAPKHNATGSAPQVGNEFDPNTLYVAVKGNIYKLSEKEYTANPITPADPGIIRQMVKYGTALAYLPMIVGPGIGAACFLVNLSSLNTTTPPTPGGGGASGSGTGGGTP